MQWDMTSANATRSLLTAEHVLPPRFFLLNVVPLGSNGGVSQFLELCNSHVCLIGWSTDQRELMGRQFTIRWFPVKIHLNVARLHEVLVVDEWRAGGLVSRLTDPDTEPNAVSASKLTIAPKDANDLPL